MNLGPLRFTPCQAKLWKGRYRRIPGKEPAYHVGTDGKIILRWFDRANGDELRVPVHPTKAVVQLGRAICDFKRTRTGYGGGAFLINEFGQVICPLTGTNDRYLLGEVVGEMHFPDPFKAGQTFSLYPHGVEPGEEWPYAYVGMAFNLRSDNTIYFQEQIDDGLMYRSPKRQDRPLIATLRRFRPSGAVRFIVNEHGAVFTKVQRDGGWTPLFIGFIDRSNWFEKEN